MLVSNSERLSYELISEQDAELLYQLDRHPEVMRHINGGKPSTMQDILEVSIPRLMQYTNPDRGWGMWKVSITENNEFIGWILVRPMNFFSDEKDETNIEMGWRFLPSCWGKGYATEAAKALKQSIMKLPEVKRISAIAAEDNAGSIAIMKKLDMSFVKTFLYEDPLIKTEVVYYELIVS